MYFTLSEQLVLTQLIYEIDVTRKQLNLLLSDVEDLSNKVNNLVTKNRILHNALETCKINMEHLSPSKIDPWYRENFLATIEAALDAAGDAK